jgi:sugar-specific transcriptional regulator TrmB
MYQELLEDIGLTKSEIAVYFALLELGQSTTGPIIKKSKIASGKAYLVLDKLINKGLVTHVIKSGTKHFQAKNPEALLDYIHEKQEILKNKEMKLKTILPSIKQKFEPQRHYAEVYEDFKGMRSFYYWALQQLKKGDRIDIFGVPREANERYQAFFMNWNRKRIEKGIKLRIMYNSDCKEFGKKRENLPLTKVKYMKKSLETPAWIVLFKDYVITVNVHQEPVCFLIKSKESASSYAQYFKHLWKESK